MDDSLANGLQSLYIHLTEEGGFINTNQTVTSLI